MEQVYKLPSITVFLIQRGYNKLDGTGYKLPSITVFLIQRGYNKLDGTGLQTPQYHCF